MRTTLTLDDDVTNKLNLRVRQLNSTLKQVVNDLLRQGLNNPSKKSSPPFRVKARSLGIKAGLSYENTAELLEQVEGVNIP